MKTKLPLLNKIEYFNPESIQPSLYDSKEQVSQLNRDFMLLKLFCDLPSEEPEHYPFRELDDGKVELHACFEPLSVIGINRIVPDILVAEKMTATILGYHKPSASAALIDRSINGNIEKVTLYDKDGKTKVIFNRKHPRVDVQQIQGVSE
jgi:hypothetical protein